VRVIQEVHTSNCQILLRGCIVAGLNFCRAESLQNSIAVGLYQCLDSRRSAASGRMNRFQSVYKILLLQND
jgi:endonuclease V-like protein UPF0215 family